MTESIRCRGVTRQNTPCRNHTVNPDGWCRRCAGIPAVAGAAAGDPLMKATTATTEPGTGGIKIVTTLSPETDAALSSARYAAQLRYPYLDRMFMSMPPVEAHGLGTVACDDTWRLYLDPEVFNNWTIEERTGALVHEALHLIHEHGARSKRLGSHDGKANHTLWNVCFPPGTLLPSGVPIEDVATMTRVVDEDLVAITTQAGQVSATVEHPFLARRRARTSYPIALTDPEWVDASDLTTGHYLCVPHLTEKRSDTIIDLSGFVEQGADGRGRRTFANHAVTAVPLDTDTAWLIGLYTAEGSSSPNVAFSLGAHEQDLVERVEKIAAVLGYSSSVHRTEHDNSARVTLGATVLGRWLKQHCGPKSQGKRIPSVILHHADPAIRRSYVEGLVAGDGFHYSDRPYCEVATSSRALAHDLVLLLAQDGIGVRFRTARQRPRQIRGRDLPETPLYRVEWSPDGPIESTRTMNGAAVTTRNARWRADDHGVWYPIRSIDAEPYAGPVYNLTTESHTYIAHGFLVHNCGDAEINEDILGDSGSGQTEGVALPEGCITPGVLREKFPDAGIEDHDTAESYYRKLHDCHCQCHNSQQGQQGQQGQGDQGQGDQGQGDQGDQGQGDQGQQGGQPGSGDQGGECKNCKCGEGQGGEGQGQPGQGQGGQGQPGQLGDGTCGGGSGAGQRQDWELDPTEGPVGTNPVEQDMALDDTAVKIAQAVKNRGDVPGNLARIAKERLAKPQVPWQKTLRSVIRQAMSKRAGMSDYTYAKPSRRRIPGVILPGMRDPDPPKIAVVVDTSGSMSDGDVLAALAEVQGIAQQTGAQGENLRLLSVDASASEPQPVYNIKDVKLKGGGGTDMRVGIAAAADMDPKPDVVIVLTDGYTPWPEERDRRHQLIPVLIHAPEQDPPQPPEWAKTVHIEPQTQGA